MYSGKSWMDISIIKDRHNTGRSIYLSTEHNSVDVAAEAFLKQLLEQTNPEQKSFSIDDLYSADFTNAAIVQLGSNEDYTVLQYSNGVEIKIFTSDYINNKWDILSSKDILYVLRTYGVDFDTSKFSPRT